MNGLLKRFRQLLLTAIAAGPFAAAAAPPASQTAPSGGASSQRFAQLVDRIARGDEVEAAAAAEALVSELLDPLAGAIGAMQSRPPQEQLRLRAALSTLSAALRLRLFRAGLPPGDAALFDEFTARYPELARQLFDDDYRVRIAAVRQLPLAPNTGVGVLLAAKVDDYDADVADAALEAAARLHDRVVARNLTRFVRDVTETIRAGHYAPHQQDIAIVLTRFSRDAIAIIAMAGYREAAPVIADALRLHGRGPARDIFEPERVLTALASLGEPSVIPVLLDYLDDNTVLRTHAAPDGRIASERLGDRALLAIITLLGLERERFGFFSAALENGEFVGFLDDAARQAARRDIRVWVYQHGIPASAPASSVATSAPHPAGDER